MKPLLCTIQEKNSFFYGKTKHNWFVFSVQTCCCWWSSLVDIIKYFILHGEQFLWILKNHVLIVGRHALFFIPRSRVQVCTCICVGERSCWNRAQWCHCSRLFQSELIDSWLFLTSPPVQLSLTFPDRKLDRKIHVWWYRAEQIWASASFRQRVFMRQTPGHHFSEPSPSGSGNFTVGKAAVWIDSVYFPCLVGFAAL